MGLQGGLDAPDVLGDLGVRVRIVEISYRVRGHKTIVSSAAGADDYLSGSTSRWRRSAQVAVMVAEAARDDREAARGHQDDPLAAPPSAGRPRRQASTVLGGRVDPVLS